MKENYRIAFWVPDTLWGKLLIPFYKIMRNRQAMKEIGLYEIISKEWKHSTLDYHGRIGYCLTIWIEK